jgi:hypothetical protein
MREYLANSGVPLDAYYLVGPPGAEMPAIWMPEIGFRYIVIEIDDLAMACGEYLRRRGTRSWGEL